MVNMKPHNLSVYHALINAKHALTKQIIVYLVMRLQTESNKVIHAFVHQDFMI